MTLQIPGFYSFTSASESPPNYTDVHSMELLMIITFSQQLAFKAPYTLTKNKKNHSLLF